MRTAPAGSSKEELQRRVAELEAANEELRGQLRALQLERVAQREEGCDGGAQWLGGVSAPGSSSSATQILQRGLSAAAGAASSGSRGVHGRDNAYEISLSVMVIDNGTAIAMPLASVLNKRYNLPFHDREADTPVVASHCLRDLSPSVSVSSYASSVCHPSTGDTRLDEMITRATSYGRPYSSLGTAVADGEARLSTSTAIGHLDGERSRPESSGCRDSDDECGVRRSKQLHEGECESGENDFDDEPPPVKPLKLPLQGGRVARSRSDDPRGVSGSLCSPSFCRGLSLDVDALISHQTLRYFDRQFRGGMASPQSSCASAIYHYIVKTFAITNGCSHRHSDLEGFGRTLCSLCSEVERVLVAEERHLSVTSPCYVFGDLHGNFRDLFYFMDNLISFQDLRYTPNRFLFLGDYVDRGEFSVEVVAYLFAMKILAPAKILLLRGNHEDTLVSGDLRGYGSTSFRAQCQSLFGTALGEELWSKASHVFAYLPLTANIDGKIFCTHGGIPRCLHFPHPRESSVTSTSSTASSNPAAEAGTGDNRLETLSRPDFPPLLSLFQVPEGESSAHRMLRQMAIDVCWADPAEDESLLDGDGFGANPRGSGVIIFGSKAVDVFLDRYQFQYIFRAHQEKADGLKMSKNARVFTIFSTSAYVGHRNGAGVVLVADNKIRLIIKHADEEEEEIEVSPEATAEHGNHTPGTVESAREPSIQRHYDPVAVDAVDDLREGEGALRGDRSSDDDVHHGARRVSFSENAAVRDSEPGYRHRYHDTFLADIDSENRNGVASTREPHRGSILRR